MSGINGVLGGLNGFFNSHKNRGQGKAAETESGKGEKSQNAAGAEANGKTENAEESVTGANAGLKRQLEKMSEKVAARAGDKAETADDDKEGKKANAAGEGVTAAADETESAASASFLDKLQELKNGFTNQLLQALGLGSLNENGKGVDFGGLFDNAANSLNSLLGGLNGGSLLGISAQYSLNISTTMSIMNADGSMQQSTFNFSLDASFDYLGIASGKGSGASSLASLFGGEGTEKTGSLLDQLREMFSPEATAQRILDFSLGFYGNSSQLKAAGGDTEEARAAYAEYIGAAIQKGFDQAMGILGNSITDQTSSEIDKTHELVFAGLDEFANGLSQKKDEDDENARPASGLSGYSADKAGLYGNLQYFASSLSVNFSSSTTYYSADEVRQLRGNAVNPYANAAQNQDNQSVGAGRQTDNSDSLNMTV